jgi:hypothetical protein
MNVCRHYVTQLQWQWGVALGFIMPAFQVAIWSVRYSQGVAPGCIVTAFQASDP